MNRHGHRHPAAAAQLPVQPDNGAGIVPTDRDVLNGRGQGIQRHPGNIAYRRLVFVNKGLYAKCPNKGTDKMKISKGIVAAVRALGGRFLALDERTMTYADIGDKKAFEKTSQALREGLTKIRREGGLAGGGVATPYSGEGYFLFSVQVLESLHNGGDGATKNASPPEAVPLRSAPVPAALRGPVVAAPRPVVAPEEAPSANDFEMLSAALDQFPGASPQPSSAPIPRAQTAKVVTPGNSDLSSSAESSGARRPSLASHRSVGKFKASRKVIDPQAPSMGDPISHSDPPSSSDSNGAHRCPSLASIGKFMDMTSIRSTLSSAFGEGKDHGWSTAAGEEVWNREVGDLMRLTGDRLTCDMMCEDEEADIDAQLFGVGDDYEELDLRFTDMSLMGASLRSIPLEEGISRPSEGAV